MALQEMSNRQDSHSRDQRRYGLRFRPRNQYGDLSHSTESLTNILRHAKASNIEIDIHTADDRWMITVRDNGVGFEEDPALYGLGLPGMRERARALDAKLDLTSRPGFGTELRLSLPLACPMGTVDQPIHQLDAYTAD